jgi:homocysteine S-methyltransferase
MVNCAHPDHFADAVNVSDPALARLRGARANASRLSHAELDEAESLDAGDPDEFGRLMAELHTSGSGLNVLGGCCGTDARHIASIARQLED